MEQTAEGAREPLNESQSGKLIEERLGEEKLTMTEFKILANRFARFCMIFFGEVEGRELTI